MGKTKHRTKMSIYDEIRKPTPKPGFAFKNKNNRESNIDDEDWQDEVDYKTIQRLKNG